MLVDKTSYCFPVNLPAFDIQKLQEKVLSLEQQLTDEAVREIVLKQPIWTINLNHLPGVEGRDRWWRHNRGHEELAKEGIREEQFTVVHPEIENSYIGEVMSIVRDYHYKTIGTAFSGRCQLVWINKEVCHQMHIDPHTPHRYHIPIFTHRNCMWLFRKGTTHSLLHMPADGRAWYLNPVEAYHVVANMSPIRRCHLLMTDGTGAP